MSLANTLSSVPLFTGLQPDQLERIARIAVDRPVDRGQMLFFERGEAEGFYIVAEGKVKIFRSAPDGREAVLHIYGVGESFGEVPMFMGGRFPASAAAVEKGKVIFLPRAELARLIREDATLAMNMLASLSGKLREFAGKIEALTLQEIPQRLSAYLLDLSEREGDADAVELDMAKGLLASFLGATRETLSRALSRMAEQSFIEVKGRTIRLLDRAGLEDLASGEVRL
ncbi:Crp/Fnr family transcriptional regulator [Desulfocurvibacter africanus]|uniref:Crp/Fnr family transcriptional regulator n=1 Tax=Desulfocurvibacter africanus TaxID=873 RepID=UPI00040C4313|nr:Crp/Fnr family transcriptional regulator [Desulfocurvibacter africanus]